MQKFFRSPTTHSIFRYMLPDERVKFINLLTHDTQKVTQGMQEILKEQPYAPAVLYVVGGNFPNHPLQKIFFEQCMNVTSKGDLSIYANNSGFTDMYEKFLKGMKHQGTDSPQFNLAQLLQQKLLQIKKYASFKALSKKKQDSFDDSFMVDDDAISMQQMTQILRQPAAVLRKDIKFSHSDLLKACKAGLLEQVKGIVSKFGLTDLSHVRGLDYDAKVLGKKQSTEHWNPLLHAIYNDHIQIVTFMTNQFGHGPIEQMLYNPKDWMDEAREEDSDDQCFGIQMAVSNQNSDLFDFIWNQKCIWLNEHVGYILPHILKFWPEKTSHFLSLKTSKELFINISLSAKSVWIRTITTRCADASDEVLEQIRGAMVESPYCVALVAESTRDLIQINREVAKGNVRVPEINQLILSGSHLIYEKKILQLDGKYEDNLIPVLRTVIRFNADHYFQKIEEIFKFIRTAPFDVKEIPLVKRSRMFRHMNLIRNFLDPLIHDESYHNFRWNIMTYCLYYGKTQIFDWLMENFNCSLMDVMKDAGDQGGKDDDEIAIDREINGRKFGSFAVYMLMLKYRNKIGLIHLAKKYPTVFTLDDFTSCIITCLEQGDFEDTLVLNSSAFQSIFNALSVDHGTGLIAECCRKNWEVMNKPPVKVPKSQRLTADQEEVMRDEMLKQHETERKMTMIKAKLNKKQGTTKKLSKEEQELLKLRKEEEAAEAAQKIESDKEQARKDQEQVDKDFFNEGGSSEDESENYVNVSKKGKHDQLALGLSRFPYSRSYLLYLGRVIVGNFNDSADGPCWYIEKQLNKCLGGLMTNDFNFLIKNAADDFKPLCKKAKSYKSSNYDPYDSDEEIQNEKICTGRMLRAIWDRVKNCDAVHTMLSGNDYESEHDDDMAEISEDDREEMSDSEEGSEEDDYSEESSDEPEPKKEVSHPSMEPSFDEDVDFPSKKKSGKKSLADIIPEDSD